MQLFNSMQRQGGTWLKSGKATLWRFRQRSRRYGWMSLTIASLVVTLLLPVWALPAQGQFPSPPAVTQSSRSLPPGVQRIGSVETAPVLFQNQELFRVTAPAVLNRDNASDVIFVEIRAEQIEANLQRVIESDPLWEEDSDRRFSTRFDPETFRVEIATLNGQTILQAVDDYRSEPQPLLTVTQSDAWLYGLSVERLSQNWQKLLQDRLQSALAARQPAEMEQQVQRAIRIGGGAIGMSVLLWFLQQFFKTKSRSLKSQLVTETTRSRASSESVTSEPASSAETHPDELMDSHRHDFLATIQTKFSLEKQLSLIALLRWLLFWSQVLLGLGTVIWILYSFPSTAALAERLMRLPIALLLIWFLIGLVNRLGDIAIARFSKAWRENELFTFEDVQRRSMRISTIIRATRGLKTFLVYVLGIGGVLGYLGVPIGSVLTVGAVVALAVSLASQSLIKDLVNGFLILSEDQYAIGDWIAVDQVDGLVENMNLRITQIRNVEGRLITIPNSTINQVENLTRSWSRTDFRVTVDYDTNIKQALAVVKQAAQDLYDDPEWQSRLLHVPEVVGVETLSHEGVTIRVWIDTQPLQQWKAGREFRLRIRLAFEEYGIKIGMPQQVIWHRTDSDNKLVKLNLPLYTTIGTEDSKRPNGEVQTIKNNTAKTK